ncbi:MAG: putative transporter [Methylacidiphilales bacterium]|nr:putative transporter [Candidatus Methylacidiphilales bacterium]
MSFLINLDSTHPIAHAVIILSLVALCGLLLGTLKIKGVGLGIAGVLFAGIAFGHFGFEIDPTILDFTREFGLVLFVYTIGMQVGPGFFSSLFKQGLALNVMAFATVTMGAIIALIIGHLMNFPAAAVAGLFSGATTSTPSLGAAQEALKTMPGVTPAEAAMPALSYAAAYPCGIMGIIGSMVALRWIFRADPAKELAAFKAEQGLESKRLHRLSIEIDADRFHGMKLGEMALLRDLTVVVTRVFTRQTGLVATASPDVIIHNHDVILAVGERENVHELCRLMGRPARIDLMKEPGEVKYRDIIVSHKAIIGQTLGDLSLEELYGVAISRITRAGVEMTAVPDVHLQFGDRVRVVGDSDDIKQVAKVLGNSMDALNRTPFVPMFIGIALGVIVGSIPIQLIGMPAPVSLGLAGGPLIVAIILGRIGRIGPFVWYMPLGANLALREMGIILFLSGVGLKAGSHFVEILLHGDGLRWMASSVFITILPLMVIGFVARLVLKHNFMNISGLLAGTTTDTAALTFANNISNSDAPSVAYATVYPLTMLLRILSAQMIVMFFR